MLPCLWGGNTPSSCSAKGVGLLSLLLGGSSSSSRLHLAAADQHGSSSSMLATTLRRIAATQAPAAILGRECAGFCAPGMWRGGSRGRRRCRPSEVAAARMMISTAGESGGAAAAGLEEAAEEEEERRVQGMIPSMSPSSISAFKQCPQLFYYR